MYEAEAYFILTLSVVLLFTSSSRMLGKYLEAGYRGTGGAQFEPGSGYSVL
jgi:hypothetical protein